MCIFILNAQYLGTWLEYFFHDDPPGRFILFNLNGKENNGSVQERLSQLLSFTPILVNPKIPI